MTGGEQVKGGAIFSGHDAEYRYVLTRVFVPEIRPLAGIGYPGDEPEGQVAFIGLNPSTANARVDDPTIRRCIGFARDWGYERLAMVNLFALRSTNPRALREHPDPVGPDNDHWIATICAGSQLVVAAWGAYVAPERIRAVIELVGSSRLFCVGKTQTGMPRHPLFVARDAPLNRWRAPVALIG